MSQFHITNAGKVAKCTATERRCPLDGEHFDSKDDACFAAESTAYAKLYDEELSQLQAAWGDADSTADEG